MNFDITKNLAMLGGLVRKHAPTILSTAGAVGVVSTTVLAVKATPSATKKVDKFRSDVAKLENATLSDEHHVEPEDIKVGPRDLIRLTWKDYLPATVSGVLTVGAIFGAHKINLNRSAALLSAYTVTDRLYTQYKDKVEGELGEEKHNKILDKIAQDRVNEDPPSRKSLHIPEGKHLFKDDMSGRYFHSTAERVRKAVNDVNENIFQVGEASLNDYYSALDIDQIALGDTVGWDNDHPLRVYFSSALVDENEPCVVVMYDTMPYNRYNRNNF